MNNRNERNFTRRYYFAPVHFLLVTKIHSITDKINLDNAKLCHIFQPHISIKSATERLGPVSAVTSAQARVDSELKQSKGKRVKLIVTILCVLASGL
jgi:hypothetical protein